MGGCPESAMLTQGLNQWGGLGFTLDRLGQISDVCPAPLQLQHDRLGHLLLSCPVFPQKVQQTLTGLCLGALVLLSLRTGNALGAWEFLSLWIGHALE